MGHERTDMTLKSLCLTTALALAASAPALAQQKAPEAAKVAIPTGVFYKGQSATQYLLKDKILGAKVLDKNGKVIGDVEDLIMSTSNEIEGVIMGVGGFLGAGEKKIGVRYSSLKFERKDGKTIVSMPVATKELLAAVEPFKRAEPPKSLVERAKEKTKELSDKAKDTAGPALEKAKEVGKAAVDKTKEVGGAAVEKGKQMMEAGKDKAAPAKQ
jgi:sporulation protein YlmC with PRC-barrel domain